MSVLSTLVSGLVKVVAEWIAERKAKQRAAKFERIAQELLRTLAPSAWVSNGKEILGEDWSAFVAWAEKTKTFVVVREHSGNVLLRARTIADK